MGLASGDSSSQLRLLTIERLRNLFLEFNVLQLYASPKYIITSFPSDCVGFQRVTECYLKNGCHFLFFDTFLASLNVDNITKYNELLFWLVDCEDRLAKLLTTWNTLAMRLRIAESILVVTRLTRAGLPKGHTLLARIPIGSRMIDMRTGMERRLSQPLQISKLTPSFESLRVESFSPNGKTLAFQGKVHNCDAILLLDTCATHSFASTAFATRNAIPLRHMGESALVADGRELTVAGFAKMHISFGAFGCNHQLRVVDLNYQFDVILGMDWLSKYKAILDCANHTCRLQKGNVKVTLSRKPVINQVSTSIHVNAIALQKAASRGCFLFAIKVENLSLEEEYDESMEWKSSSNVEGEVEIPAILRPLIREYGDVFPEEIPKGLPPIRQTGHTIPLVEDAKPAFRPLYRLSPFEHEEVRIQIADLLEKGWIEPSSSPFGAPILFVQKKDKSLRMCIDYRALNKQTVKNRYALPRIDDLMDQLSGARYFTSLDLAQGYHQIRVTPEDVPKTAFRTPLGHFQYLVLPFGLTNAPATFQSMMNDIFREYLGQTVLVYLDDILVYSRTPAEHVTHVRDVLNLLRKHKLYAKMKKCQFMTRELLYLGHIIGEQGVKPDPAKIAALADWKTPMNVHDVRSFLGFGNYFRKFVQAYSSLVLPLTDLTKKDKPFEWTTQCEQAFRGVIWNLTNAPVLAIADPKKPYEVVCDASGWALGAVLLQEGRPIAFESRKMAAAELNYTVSEQELLAVVYALRTWRCYLEGCKGLVIVTDHKPNSYINSQEMLSRRQSRWSEFLSRFDYELVYRPGRTNVADPLSRLRINAITRSLARDNKESCTNVGSRELLTQHLTNVPSEGPDGGYIATDNPQSPTMLHDNSRDIIEWIRSAYSYDPLFRGDQGGQEEQLPSTLTRDLTNGLWYQNGKIRVPNSNDLKLRIISEYHDTPYSGHFGIAKTMASITRDFVWPGLKSEVKAYVLSCDTCQRSKSSNLRPAGKLMPLPIPPRRWSSVSMDFIMELPVTRRGY